MRNFTIKDIKPEYEKLDKEYISQRNIFKRNYFSINPLRTKRPLRFCLDLNYKLRKLRFNTENRIFDLKNRKKTPINNNELYNLEILLQNCNDRIDFIDFFYNKIISESSNNNALFALAIAIISFGISIYSFFHSQ